MRIQSPPAVSSGISARPPQPSFSSRSLVSCECNTDVSVTALLEWVACVFDTMVVMVVGVVMVVVVLVVMAVVWGVTGRQR